MFSLATYPLLYGRHFLCCNITESGLSTETFYLSLCYFLFQDTGDV